MILLDTHVAFWLNWRPERLSRAATRAIRRAAAGPGFGLSAISLWELAMLFERGTLRVKDATTRAALDALLETPGLLVVEITAEIATLAARFPRSFPGDPADRLIAGTATALDVPLVTKDSSMQQTPLLRTVW